MATLATVDFPLGQIVDGAPLAEAVISRSSISIRATLLTLLQRLGGTFAQSLNLKFSRSFKSPDFYSNWKKAELVSFSMAASRARALLQSGCDESARHQLILEFC